MTLSKVLLSEKAAVASEHPLASFAGYDILREGGNAVDAAVATSFALAVTLHQVGGLGGDFFALIYEATTGEVHCLNSSGWAPGGLTLDLLRSRGDKEVPLFGARSVVVPGLVAGVCAMHKKLGRLDFEALPEAAIGYSRKGFPATESLCRSVRANFELLSKGARKIFAPGGAPPRLGAMIRQQKLAHVIEDVSKGGERAFYRGPPGEAICSKLNDEGVPTKKSDFSSFKPDWVRPLRMEYGGMQVYEFPPNSMGATSLLMLEYLSSQNLLKTGPLSKERVQATMRAAELAYGRRDEMLGDPRFSKIDLRHFMDLSRTQAEGSRTKLRDGDTTAFSVVDEEGNMVSGIQSLFHHFGSRVFVDECGLLLSNRAAGFSMQGPNKLEPRKRPLHTLSSLLLAEGDAPKVSIGCSGGDYRPMQHTLFVTNIVDYHMNLEQSIDHPRFLRTGVNSMISERGYDDLAGLSYEVKPLPHPGGTGVCHGIEVLPGARKAVCDVRGDGLPAGY